MRTLWLLAVALLALAAPARAQELRPGARVRVTAPLIQGQTRYVGTVMSTDGGRIRMRLDPTLRQVAGDTISIPASMVQQVEISMGRAGRSRTAGARTGAVAGLAAGIGLGLALGSKSPNGALRTSLWLGPTVAVAGAAAGGVLGAGGDQELWRPLQPPAGLALGKRLTLSIRLGF